MRFGYWLRGEDESEELTMSEYEDRNSHDEL
jgi:hypothetical protein